MKSNESNFLNAFFDALSIRPRKKRARIDAKLLGSKLLENSQNHWPIVGSHLLASLQSAYQKLENDGRVRR